MTVQELIDNLSEFPKDMQVVVGYRYDGGDFSWYDEEIRLEQVADVLEL